MAAYLLTEMTWQEVEIALDTVQLAIIPVGAHEQHGPHMNESCDAVLATEMGKKLTERLYPYALMTPTINMGISYHHINFPGTITLRPETLIALMRDMITSLKHHGIKKFLFLNAHGGNQSTLGVGCVELSHELGVEAYYAKTTASAKEAIAKHVKSELFGHSCEREVSEAYYLAPQLVRPENLCQGEINHEGRWKQLRPGNPVQGPYQYEEMTRNGNIGDGRLGSYEAGKEIVEESLNALEQALRELLDLQEERVNPRVG